MPLATDTCVEGLLLDCDCHQRTGSKLLLKDFGDSKVVTGFFTSMLD